jgi:hypothetical protein
MAWANTWGGGWGTSASGVPIYGRRAGAFDANRYFGGSPGIPGSVDEILFQGDPQFAYRTAVNSEADQGSDYYRWLAGRQQWVMDNYTNASRSNPNLLATDYIPQALQDLAQRYTQLSGWQQGKNPAAWFAGRRL